MQNERLYWAPSLHVQLSPQMELRAHRDDTIKIARGNRLALDLWDEIIGSPHI